MKPDFPKAVMLPEFGLMLGEKEIEFVLGCADQIKQGAASAASAASAAGEAQTGSAGMAMVSASYFRF